MADLSFESITASVTAGSPVDGVLRLRAARPVRARDFTITLIGSEKTSATYQSGKHSHVARDEHVFLAQRRSLKEVVASALAPDIAAGEYRIPFRFIVPPDAPATMSIGGSSEGARMSYAIEARVDVPWWPDAVARSAVTVLPPGRILGRAPGPTRGSRSWAGRSKAELFFRPDAGLVQIGRPFTGEFRIQNPQRKRVRKVTISLARHVEWRAGGHHRSRKGPTFTLRLRIASDAPALGDRFSLSLAPHAAASPPWSGNLITVTWNVRVSVDVAWGFDAGFEIPIER